MEPLPKPKSKSAARKTPPNPPITRCTNCVDFTFKGSTAYTVKKTCRDFRHVTVTRREENYQYAFENCPHTDVDHRGSSKTAFRTFFKQCGCFINEMPIAEHQHRVQVAERVENTDPQTLQVVTSLTGDGANDRMSSAEVQAVLAALTQSLLDSGPKSPADLHWELDDAIIEVMTEQDPDAFPPDSDEPDWAPVDEGAPLSLADLSGPRGFMAVRSDPDTGDVTLDLPIVDVMSMDDPDIYAALDEGCNSTCHSQQCAEMCDTKLRKYGVAFKWVNHEVTSFVGIGSKTGTCGSRSMPIALEATDGSVIQGKLESYEIQGKTSTPLLLSLYAQVTLGMIKDLSAGKIYVTVNSTQRELPLAKCSKTGLLLLNLTAGIRKEVGKLGHDQSPEDTLKFLRPFRRPVRTACAGALGEAMDRSHAVFRLMGSTDAHVSLEGRQGVSTDWWRGYSARTP